MEEKEVTARRKLQALAMFHAMVGYIINILIFYIIFILMAGLLKILYPINVLFEQFFFKLDLSRSVSDILTFLVMIELFRSFIEYLKVKRIRLHSMIDPAIIFIIRELIVMLYSHTPLVGSTLMGFAGLLLALGIVRTMAVIFSPREEGPA
ncbi:MAG: phosphate-starvation-inducible PsiE family protein [Desulfocapsaceae bacterium]|nr:phosphate-starvation-inducible PsiE family protein [Desulfocapsaceae bacterium]